AKLGNFTGVEIRSASNTVGGTQAGAGNLISGNTGAGVNIVGSRASGNLLQGNQIGTSASGTAPPGNGTRVLIQSASNTVAGNTIAFNGGAGVAVTGSTGNGIRGNGIRGNGGLGIDLGNDGVTPNDATDADTGPNNLQNFPSLGGASSSSLTHTTTVG